MPMVDVDRREKNMDNAWASSAWTTNQLKNSNYRYFLIGMGKLWALTFEVLKYFQIVKFHLGILTLF